MNQESSRVEWGKQKEILISIFGSVRNQGMIEIGDMRYIEDFFHLGELWLEFQESLRRRQLALESTFSELLGLF